MENAKKRFKVSRWIFLSISVLLNAFIIFQSCLDGATSSKWSNFLSNLFESILNSGEGVIAPRVPVSSVTLFFQESYQYNHIAGYQDNEIPLGCTKLLNAQVLPLDASDSSITWSSSDEDIVYLNRQGKNLAVMGNKTGTVTITATSNYNHEIKDTFELEVVDLVEPVNFSISASSIEIPLDGGDLVPINIIADELILKTYDQDIFLQRYYDVSKLTYTSSDPSIVEIKEVEGLKNVLFAKASGNAVVSVSNSNGIQHDITVNVVAEQPAQLLPTIEDIVCYADDMDVARTDNTTGYPLGLNDVMYLPTDPLHVQVSNDGRAIGYRKTTHDDVQTSIKVIDKHNITNSKLYDVVLTDPPLIDFSLTISGAKYLDSHYELEMGNTISVSITNVPSNVYSATFTITSSNNSVATITHQGNSFFVNCLKEGQVVITVTCNENTSISKSFNVTVTKRGVINTDNRNDFRNFVRKSWGHFLLFVINGIFTTIALYQFLSDKFKKWWIVFIISLGVGFFVAGLSELIQSIVPGRSGAFLDATVDAFGFFLSTLIIYLIMLSIRLTKKKKKE